jgi:hypothetical protein
MLMRKVELRIIFVQLWCGEPSNDDRVQGSTLGRIIQFRIWEYYVGIERWQIVYMWLKVVYI